MLFLLTMLIMCGHCSRSDGFSPQKRQVEPVSAVTGPGVSTLTDPNTVPHAATSAFTGTGELLSSAATSLIGLTLPSPTSTPGSDQTWYSSLSDASMASTATSLSGSNTVITADTSGYVTTDSISAAGSSAMARPSASPMSDSSAVAEASSVPASTTTTAGSGSAYRDTALSSTISPARSSSSGGAASSAGSSYSSSFSTPGPASTLSNSTSSSSAGFDMSQTPSAIATVNTTTTFYTTVSTEVTVTLPSGVQEPSTVELTGEPTLTVSPIGPVTPEPHMISSPSNETTPAVFVTATGPSISTVTVYITFTPSVPTTVTTVTVMEFTPTICSGSGCSLTTPVSSYSPPLSSVPGSNSTSPPSTTTYSYSTFWQSYSSYMAAHHNTTAGLSGAYTSNTSSVSGSQESIATPGSSAVSSPSVSRAKSSLPPGVFVFPDTNGIGYSWSVITLPNGHLTQTRLGPLTTTCSPTATGTTVGLDGITTFHPECKSGPGPMVTPGVTPTPTATQTGNGNGPSSAGGNITSATSASASASTPTTKKRRDPHVRDPGAHHTIQPRGPVDAALNPSSQTQVDGWMARLSRFFVLPFQSGAPNPTTLATVVRDAATTTVKSRL
ncbi:hypothetical protein A1O3_00609 [Capronia epimyces CBS 606.96]|uniref:REJ domain-containing protein n=1 Tax=Capronia epimyces CBS 606.96 TaxID=1182542 RepID=W9ZC21_9EURO|nr:uncharacterized protein A1O3_00609 [Capronia epimyces CBS 606.96]EXJ92059.1 hypothetical protein A1O3_00609 [Capronia epimyces CBS 606.96]